jgi:hypothetical protein
MPARREPEAAEPRWLSTDQLAAWRGFMNLPRRLPAALELQLQQDSQLSFIEYDVLALLSDQSGRRMRMSQLAVKVNSEQAHVLVLLRFTGYSDASSLACVACLWSGMTWPGGCRLSG